MNEGYEHKPSHALNSIESLEKQAVNNILIAKTKDILLNLTQALKDNRRQQNLLNKQYFQLLERQKRIENTLDKVKTLSKSKQKKHYKYFNYIPLSKIYFYSPKKNPFYYMLLDIIISCRKKNKQKFLSKPNYSNYNTEEGNEVSKNNNRFNFTKNNDLMLKSLLSYENENDIDWEGIGASMQRVPLHIFVRNLELSNFYDYKKWTIQEDTILKKSIIYYGPKNWQQISYCLDGKFLFLCLPNSTKIKVITILGDS